MSEAEALTAARGTWTREQRLADLTRAARGEVARATKLPLVAVGDAFDKVEQLADNSVDCVLTSPPYWGLRSYGFDHDETILTKWQAEVGGQGSEVPPYDWYRKNGGILGLEPFPEWYVAHLVELFAKFRRTLLPGANLWVNIGDTYFARWSSIRHDGRQGLSAGERTRRRTPSGGYLHDKQLLLIPSRFAIAMQQDGWIVRNDVIWDKPGVPPRPEVDRLRLSHEHFFHFVQKSRIGRPTYWYDVQAAEPGQRDVVSVGAGRGRRGHSATFPRTLIDPRIASSCPPGGLVVDPFCGTGTTLESALALGRRAHGIELSDHHAATARARVRAQRAAGHQDTETMSD